MTKEKKKTMTWKVFLSKKPKKKYKYPKPSSYLRALYSPSDAFYVTKKITAKTGKLLHIPKSKNINLKTTENLRKMLRMPKSFLRKAEEIKTPKGQGLLDLKTKLKQRINERRKT